MFNPIKRMRERRKAYRAIFLDDKGELSPFAKIVIGDLARFARAHESTFTTDITGRADPVAMAYREGRRETYLRIIKSLHLDDASVIEAQETERLLGE